MNNETDVPKTLATNLPKSLAERLQRREEETTFKIITDHNSYPKPEDVLKANKFAFFATSNAPSPNAVVEDLTPRKGSGGN